MWSPKTDATPAQPRTPDLNTEPTLVVRPSRDGDVEAMLAIYARHIRQGIETDVGETGVPLPDDIRDRRKNLRSRRFPHLVATLGGTVVGYAYVVIFRKRPAYRFVVKHSVYVHHDHLGRGIGKRLMAELIDACAAGGFRQMIGYVDGDNVASLALHASFGFEQAGRLKGVGFKHGRWADSVLVQRSLGAGSTAPPPPSNANGRSGIW
jgi:L-amino acid N-acyltransferase YncA